MQEQKIALITGITGQDGSYLTELLLEKGYKVVGIVNSQPDNIGEKNITHVKDKISYEVGSITDKDFLTQLIGKYQPDEIYNLAGISFIPAAWESPSDSLLVNAVAVSYILEIILKHSPKSRLFQASSARIFGSPIESPQTEESIIRPVDPYGVSKAAAHRLVGALRSKHESLFAVSGILYNHESERRGPEFVTRKITMAAAKISKGLEKDLTLGDLDAVQDWGYARDYVEAMWMSLQADKPDDYIFATGKAHSVRDVCEIAFKEVELDYNDYVKVDQSLVRPPQKYPSIGNPAKAHQLLGWQPKTSFEQMIKQMVHSDLELLERE